MSHLQRLSRDPRVENVLSLIVVSVLDELLADVAHLRASKGGAVVVLALEHPGLAAKQLHQLTHSHSGGEAVRVHDHVHAHALQKNEANKL